ncbi:interleukin-2 receptor subunit beta-like [Seriola dumerili]|uniref:Interleukin-2 receptor subunit beta-like n=1 Tax=Seriola dumerili TaxID=41447 RepID=A0A3B4UHD6_SERDU|nr:interleukin-2 receptor subunit beta-like [Seriola dumerili]XP_022593968.1 interleukin-2 receptor subunit beta-like [Seriola dumerili]XP_022593969.1 interleukin-2 receptor subunit beta-like [Seriola dumerili]XP_022593970.1 interleukin-2 receptor subunit beta-like [Seriola dumerili]
MERIKKSPLLFLLLALLHVCAVRMDVANCPSHPDKNLTCYNDYNRNITCVWNTAYEHTDAVCTLHAKRNTSIKSIVYYTSCNLEPVNISRPAQRKCSLYFKRRGTFYEEDVYSINLSCKAAKQNLTISYMPVCHVKLNHPGKPDINSTTVSWVITRGKIKYFNSELQWKKGDQSWNDPSVQKKYKYCNLEHETECKTELDPDLLIKGERYEARVRVKATVNWVKSTWSDWSPTESWESLEGRPKPPPLSGVAAKIWGMIIAGAGFAFFLAVILLRNDKGTWVYKKIKGSPIPDPGKSSLKDMDFQNWLSPHSTSELFLSFKLEEIISVEVTSSVNAVTRCKKEAALLEKMKNENGYESTSSSFSNPSYSQPLVSPSTAGNVEPCAADTPNGSVGSQGDGKTAEEVREEERKKELEIQQLLSKGNNNSEPVQVISDYEKPLVEHQSSGEEVSQESLEADSIGAPDSHDEGSEGKEQEREGGDGKVDFKMLFGGSGSLFGKGSIQVCSDYEQVQRMPPCSPELPSMDSGVCSGSEEQLSHEESLEDFDKSIESTSFQFPLTLPCTLPCVLSSFPQLPLKFSGTDMSQPLQPSSPSHKLAGIALMAMSRSMEPSGDGYMPARQEES